MARVKVKMNIPGCIELRKSDEVRDLLREYASDVSARAGDGFEIEAIESHDRAKYTVTASSASAKARCYRGNVLIKAIGGLF